MAPTNSFLQQTLLKGILGGALVGLLIGAYVVVLSSEYVVQREDFAVPIRFEQTEGRYASAVLLAFTTVFAAVGPFIAAASFGSWIQDAVYGLVASIAIVVGITLIAAWLTNQQPFNMRKGSNSTCIDIARVYLLPAALVAGPAIGVLLGRRAKASAVGRDE